MAPDDDPRDRTGRRRRVHMTADERDVIGVGHRARTASLEYPGDDDSPVEVHAEITDVHELQRRVAERMGDAPDAIRDAAVDLIAVLAEHQHAGERRSANLAALAAAGHGPTVSIAPATPWWSLALKVGPVALGAIATVVLWIRSADAAAADLRARIGALEVEARRTANDIDALRAGQKELWQRLFFNTPVRPAPPGDLP